MAPEHKLNNEQRSRPGHTIARRVKGHPRRALRRARAMERLAAHTYGLDCRHRSGVCPKAPQKGD